MSEQKYAFQGYDEKTMAKAIGKSLAISTKKSVEVSNLLRGKSVKRAKIILEQVAELKTPVPYKRYNQELAHQTAIGPGGFPVSVAKEVLKLLKNVEANAASKGLDTDSLKIIHMCAHLASRPFHYGRKRRVKAKRTHVEIVVSEGAEKPVKKAVKKSAQKKTESKKSVEKSVEKTTEKQDVAKTEDSKTETPVVEKSAEEPAKETIEEKKDDIQ